MTIVTGFDPKTGEEISVEFRGNFPLKDPDSNKFITHDDGEVMFPGRVRAAHSRFNKFGQEILDTRPMAASVMFSDHIPPEQKLRQMMQDANFRAQLRAYMAEEQGVDTFDEFEYDDEVLFGSKDPVSAHEMVYDKAANTNVPRFLEGALKAAKKAVQKGTGPLATPPANASASSPEASETADGDEDEGA